MDRMGQEPFPAYPMPIHRRGVETAIQAVLCPFDDAPAKQTPYDPLFGLSILSMSIALTHQDSWGSEILGGAKIYFDKGGQKLCPIGVVVPQLFWGLGVSMKILTPDELRFLTGKKHSNAQVRELNHMGIPFNQRTNGSLVVCDVDIPLTLNKLPKEVRFTING